MAPSDSKAPFLRIPWTAALLKRENIICRVPGSRKSKDSGEDTLFAEILKTPRTIRSCLSLYTRPPPEAEKIEEVSTLMTIGDGVNGHPGIMHGGIIAAILDEGMGILQSCNFEREHFAAVSMGKAEGEIPPSGYSFFTAELKIQYKKPVMTSAPLICTARFVKRERGKEWIYAEVKQRVGMEEDYNGDEVVCATGEALFVDPNRRRSKL
jgi:acyl-coenzyme A thioesterase PaaI-like protein